MARTRGRRAGGLDTRGAILDEARRQFASAGYAGTTMRGVAAGAGVDPRLVLHYFGSKRGLFHAAVELPVDPDAVVATVLRGGDEGAGDRAASFVLFTLADPEMLAVFTGLLRSAIADDEAAAAVRDVLTERLLLPIARGIGADRPELRAGLMSTQLIGLLVARHVIGIESLVDAPDASLREPLARTLGAYLTGPLPGPAGEDGG